MQSLPTSADIPSPRTKASAHEQEPAQVATQRVVSQRVVAQHANGVFRFARAIGADRDLACDLTQEAFALAWQKGKFELPTSALASFLRRTIRLLWLQHCRAQRRREDYLQEAAISAASEQLAQHDTPEQQHARIAAIRACTRKLTERAHRAVQLCYHDGKGRAQIAKALDMTPNGVKTLLARTRRWLEQCMQRSAR